MITKMHTGLHEFAEPMTKVLPLCSVATARAISPLQASALCVDELIKAWILWAATLVTESVGVSARRSALTTSPHSH